ETIGLELRGDLFSDPAVKDSRFLRLLYYDDRLEVVIAEGTCPDCPSLPDSFLCPILEEVDEGICSLAIEGRRHMYRRTILIVRMMPLVLSFFDDSSKIHPFSHPFDLD